MSKRADPSTYKPVAEWQKHQGRHKDICDAWRRGLSSGTIARMMRAKYKAPCSVGYVVNIAAQYGVKHGPAPRRAARSFAQLGAEAFR